MSNDEKFIFDTSVWIWMNNLAYPREQFPSIWNWLTKTNNIYYIKEIKSELSVYENSLENWFKKQNNIKLIPTADPTTINNTYYHKASGTIVDSQIIASAKECSLIIVTDEKEVKGQTKEELEEGKPNPKIPNVCKYEGVTCIAMQDFWKRTEVSF